MVDMLRDPPGIGVVDVRNHQDAQEGLHESIVKVATGLVNGTGQGWPLENGSFRDVQQVTGTLVQVAGLVPHLDFI